MATLFCSARALRQSQLSLLRQYATETTVPRQSGASSQAPSPELPPPIQLSYFVPRSSTNGTGFGVYHDYTASAGPLTLIKHARGDLNVRPFFAHRHRFLAPPFRPLSVSLEPPES